MIYVLMKVILKMKVNDFHNMYVNLPKIFAWQNFLLSSSEIGPWFISTYLIRNLYTWF